MRKSAFYLCENKAQVKAMISCSVYNHTADLRLGFHFIDSAIPLFLNPKFQASRHLLCLYSPVCVGPGRKPRRQIFSLRGSYIDVHQH